LRSERRYRSLERWWRRRVVTGVGGALSGERRWRSLEC